MSVACVCRGVQAMCIKLSGRSAMSRDLMKVLGSNMAFHQCKHAATECETNQWIFGEGLHVGFFVTKLLELYGATEKNVILLVAFLGAGVLHK